MAWIEAHRHELVPPVANRQVFPAGDFIIMVVGGPNARDDYHVDPGAEFFYQFEGTLTLRTMQEGRPVDYAIGPGRSFCCPPLCRTLPNARPARWASWWNAAGNTANVMVFSGIAPPATI